MATIKAIESRSVHQIQSGQVIVDLQSAVKELVENSLDAGATSIEIRFKNHGLDAIEVQDNGKGISPEDYENVALKHYTSKLSTFDDLSSLDTFGFRGEALSSLSALSHLNILTSRSEDAVGKKLEFEQSGKLKSATASHAPKGTSISVEHLFFNLPVRRRELEKNSKREYTKVLDLLNSYACISVGVRIAVSNQMPKGKKIPVSSTKANQTTRENIANVFGAKTLLALLPLDLCLEMASSSGQGLLSSRTVGTSNREDSLQVHVQGHISKPIFGEGRQAPDRQMFFVNSRPCQLPQIKKAINEVYKQFNVSQSPFVFANLIMDTSTYDVNVSPDKRTIMLHDQTALLESLKVSLTELFDRTDHTIPQATLPNKHLSSYQPLTLSRNVTEEDNERISLSDTDVDDGANVVDADAHACLPKLIRDRLGHGSIDHSANQPSTRAKRRIGVSEKHTPSSSDNDEVPAHSLSTNAADRTKLFVDPHSEDDIDDVDEMDNNHSSQAVPSPFARREMDDASSRTSPDAQLSQDSSQAPIPVLSLGPQKPIPGPIENAFNRMRPKRMPQGIAEITVGDKTFTTSIGSGAPFRRHRIHEPKKGNATFESAATLLARGLRSNFAAPGSQLEPQTSSAEVDSESELGPQDTNNGDADMNAEERPDEAGSHSERRSRPYSTGLGESTSDQYSHPSLLEVQSHAQLSTSAQPEGFVSSSLEEGDDEDEDYLDEAEKRSREDARIAAMIQEAETDAEIPSEENIKRAQLLLKHIVRDKNSTLKLATDTSISIDQIKRHMSQLRNDRYSLDRDRHGDELGMIEEDIGDAEAEAKLSLTVIKADFLQMQVIGQFNLGFILALRPGTTPDAHDDLFIIDQHAADEKYNYERLQRTVVMQDQRLVRPWELELTAAQQEIVLHYSGALSANGFKVEAANSLEDFAAGDDNAEATFANKSFHLVTVPMSREKAFDLSDLEELIHLLSEQSPGSHEIPRPKKVQKMLAMRACRSSIMVGKTLTTTQMEKVVRHMGDMDKPWNCPHGRPTMRHLANLGEWSSWREPDTSETDWAAWLANR